MTDVLIRLPEVIRRTGLSRSTIYAGIARGWFPAPLKVSPETHARAAAWLESEVQGFIRERIAASGRGAA